MNQNRVSFTVLACALMYMTTVNQSVAQTLTSAIINGEQVTVEISHIELVTRSQCGVSYCDQHDSNCDGVLETVCPGLEYDICVDGSIVQSYIDAAFTGQCYTPGEDQLCISPCYRAE